MILQSNKRHSHRVATG